MHLFRSSDIKESNEIMVIREALKILNEKFQDQVVIQGDSRNAVTWEECFMEIRNHREEVGDHHGHIQCPFQVMYRSSNDMMVISAKQGIDSIHMIVHFCLCFSFFLGKMIFHGLHLHSVCVCVCTY